MSRIRVSHQPDGWLDDGPAFARKQGYRSAHVSLGGQMVVAVSATPPKSDKGPSHHKAIMPSRRLICDYRNAIECARAKGHKGPHESRQSLDARNARKRSQEAIA